VARILIREGLAHPYVCGSLGYPKRKAWPVKPTRAASHRDARRTPQGWRFSAVAISKPRRRGSRPKARTGGNYNRAGGRRTARSGGAAKCPHPRPRLRCGRRVHDSPDHLADRTCRSSFSNYVLRPAGLIGHCNVRLSLNVAGEFRTSKKYRLSLKTLGLRTRLPLWSIF